MAPASTTTTATNPLPRRVRTLLRRLRSSKDVDATKASNKLAAVIETAATTDMLSNGCNKEKTAAQAAMSNGKSNDNTDDGAESAVIKELYDLFELSTEYLQKIMDHFVLEMQKGLDQEGATGESLFFLSRMELGSV